MASIVVMILPLNSVSNPIFNDKVFGKYFYEILTGRISFLDQNNKPVNGNQTGTIVIYFKKRILIKAISTEEK